MIPKINITGDGITLSMKVDGEYKPFVTCGNVGAQLRDYIADATGTMTENDFIEKAFKRGYLGEFDKKEEINMNKVLELYKEREEKRIKDKYEKLKEDMHDDNLIVKDFKELEEKTKQSYEELCNKYNTEEVHYINRTGYGYESGYELSTNIMNDIHEKLAPDFNKEMEELHDKVRDIEALLSISYDKDYQLEVLKNYGLLDKKGSIVR